ncbi:sodium- and chloride-dependent glycine transporter 1-like isoform X1 [Phymastichus coffea]|uniref:sodium- and chloride-dependent glycine transporter 1-like isoform X1 n=2 Tax=Phymastichus coffea TaxID=108790 RepID=UPI00273BE1C1|nr:sodium- and chloride-dependent glycine transporter 1-like isoform X1 [Phymastichus coffea]
MTTKLEQVSAEPEARAQPPAEGEERSEPARGSWASKTEFLLSCAGYAIGIGNVWRFPYLCYRNGGGAFLVPYLLMLFLCGIPLFFMESSMGQFGGTGCITMFRMSPLFKGAGFAIVIVNVICTMYYNVVIAYPLMFLAMSFRQTLPWEGCDNPWNTYNCLKLGGEVFAEKNETDQIRLIEKTKTPADEFFHNHILEISGSINELGGIVWPLFACNVVSWIIVYLCICNGVKTVGKVVYFTATFPFVILFILFVRGVTLPGATDGILFYIMPKWEELLNLKVWADAAIQIFFSLGPGWGGIVNMASYNPFRNNNRLDSILVPILNCGTSIFAGFVVFSVLGFMSFKTGLPISTVATGGPGLAFVTYPEAITMLPFPQLWAVLFFTMLYLLGMDSCFVQIEAIISSVTDAYPELRRRKSLVTFGSLVILFIGSTIFVTNGGMYVLQMFDWYAASISVISICLVEVIVVGWTYGCENFVRDVEFMIGEKLHWWWPFCWKYMTPVILSFIFVTTVLFNTRITYNGVDYPEWAVAVGWCSCLVSMLCIPGYIICYLVFGKGTLAEKIAHGTNPTSEWGPTQAEDREAWEKFVKSTRRLSNHPLVNGVKVTGC